MKLWLRSVFLSRFHTFTRSSLSVLETNDVPCSAIQVQFVTARSSIDRVRDFYISYVCRVAMISFSLWSNMGPMKVVLLLITLVHLSTAQTQSKLHILHSECVCVRAQYSAINVYIHTWGLHDITVHSRALLAEFSPAWPFFRSMYVVEFPHSTDYTCPWRVLQF